VKYTGQVFPEIASSNDALYDASIYLRPRLLNDQQHAGLAQPQLGIIPYV